MTHSFASPCTLACCHGPLINSITFDFLKSDDFALDFLTVVDSITNSSKELRILNLFSTCAQLPLFLDFTFSSAFPNTPHFFGDFFNNLNIIFPREGYLTWNCFFRPSVGGLDLYRRRMKLHSITSIPKKEALEKAPSTWIIKDPNANLILDLISWWKAVEF